MSRVITLTTDFGTRDGYVGAMKGRILSLCPHVQLVDLSHEIPPQDAEAAAWCLARAAPEFPSGTIHLVVVDPGVGSERHALVLQAGEQKYVGPDNGVFERVRADREDWRAWRIARQGMAWHAHASFAGLTLFAPVAAHLAAGGAIEQIGDPTGELVRLESIPPRVEGGLVHGRILCFDRFGNALTNIPAALLPESAEVVLGERTLPMLHHYAEGTGMVGMGLINSDDLLEIAVSGGSAREALGLRPGDPVCVCVSS